MAESRYIKKTKRYRNEGLNKHHHDGSSSKPSQPTHSIESASSHNREPTTHATPTKKTKKSGSITARLAVQFVVLFIVAGFYVNFFYQFLAVFAAIPAIAFLTFWGGLLHKTSPHRSPGSLAFESGLIVLVFIWIVRLGNIEPAYKFLMVLFDPVELGYRMGDAWAEAQPFTIMAWALEIILLPIIPPIRIQRAKKPKSDYDPFK